MTEVMLTAALRDLVYLFVALTAFAIGLHYTLKLLGFRYAEIMDKLDNNPLAIGVFLGLLAHSIGSLVGTILH